MKKGKATKNGILEKAMEMAGQLGLEGVSIGGLAKATGMSKSGLFGHFQSKENLQLAILEYAITVFTEKVAIPSLQTKAGIPRIQTLVDRWIDWSTRRTGGCIFVIAGADFSDRPGKVRDRIREQQEDWVDSLSRIARSAIRAGDFREDIDCDQFAFEFYSLLLGFHLYHKLLGSSDVGKRQKTAINRFLAIYRR
jgi:AcrR family transcriptional regulator